MFHCELCTKAYKSSRALTKHSTNKHSKKTKKFICNICSKIFDKKDSLKKHKLSHKFSCKKCLKIYKTKFFLEKHEEQCQYYGEEESDSLHITCQLCDEVLIRKNYTSHLRSNQHITKSMVKIDSNCFVYKTALKNKLVIYRIIGNDEHEDENISVKHFLHSLLPCIEKVIANEILAKYIIKFRFNVSGIFTRPTEEHEILEESLKFFQSEFYQHDGGSKFSIIFNKMVEEVGANVDDFQEMMSGFTIVKWSHVDLELCQISLLSSGSYIPLPDSIQNKKACINIQNHHDNKCFLYSILCSFFYKIINKDNLNDVFSYKPYMNFFNLDGISFPITLKEINRFERNNEDKQISVNIYILEGTKVNGPIYITKNEKTNHANLLLIEKFDRSHFVWIKSLSRLVRPQLLSSHKELYFCNTCLSVYKTGSELEFHYEVGCEHVKVELPLKKPYLEFSNYKSRQIHPFVMYGDIECILQKYNTVEPDPRKSYTLKTQLHTPSAYGYVIQTTVNDKFLHGIRLKSGENCMSDFVQKLVSDVKYIYEKYLKVVKPMSPLTADEVSHLNSVSDCHICKDEFKPSDVVVLDHCHILGNFLGKAHQRCNIMKQTPRFIPFIVHGGSSYDYHVLIMELAKHKLGTLSVLPKTKENYISFNLRMKVEYNANVDIRFLDSYRFLSSSLAKLTESMSSCPRFEKYNRKLFPDMDFYNCPEKQYLPYEYYDSWEKLDETELPPIESFYSSLKNENIAPQDYVHACNVFNNLPVKTLRSYLEYYLKNDILILADVFEEFRKTVYDNFHLDCVFYYTLPAISFDSCLLKTRKKIGLMTDGTMYNLINSNIRGGISTAMIHYIESNNKYMRGGYDSAKGPPVYNTYLDVNALYAYTMTQYKLPDSEYQFIEHGTPEFEKICNTFMKIPIDGDYGYVVVCDVDYPSELHDYHNCLPFLTEKMQVGKVKKLIPNLFNKRNYVCHLAILQQAICHGLQLVKIHRILKFHQSFWVREYIEDCTRLRSRPTNSDFQRDLWKCAANVIFGKLLQNTSRYKTVNLVTKWDNRGTIRDASKLLRNPKFKSFSIFSEDLVAIESQKSVVKYDRPILSGFSILELSKHHFYHLIYDVIKRNLNVKLAYLDTDSCFLSSNHDIYQFMREFSCFFDTSDFGENNKFSITPQNRKVPGLLKDEGKGLLIKRFVALKSKAYSIEFETPEGVRVINKLKSVSKSTSKTFTFDHYYNIWKTREVLYSKMVRILSKDHVLNTVSQNKKSLSSDDDKRYQLPDNIFTLALGHVDIME